MLGLVLLQSGFLRDYLNHLQGPPPGGTRLTAEIDLAWLNANGTLQLPENVTDIMIEIGANSRNTMDIEVLPKRATSFLITFEPILDKYATLLSRNSRADTKSILGRHHTRGTVLPYAVAANDGFATFHMSPVDGCSSLLASQFSRFGGLCAPSLHVGCSVLCPHLCAPARLREARDACHASA